MFTYNKGTSEASSHDRYCKISNTSSEKISPILNAYTFPKFDWNDSETSEFPNLSSSSEMNEKTMA